MLHVVLCMAHCCAAGRFTVQSLTNYGVAVAWMAVAVAGSFGVGGFSVLLSMTDSLVEQ